MFLGNVNDTSGGLSAVGFIGECDAVLVGLEGAPEVSPILTQVNLQELTAAIFTGDIVGRCPANGDLVTISGGADDLRRAGETRFW